MSSFHVVSQNRIFTCINYHVHIYVQLYTYSISKAPINWVWATFWSALTSQALQHTRSTRHPPTASRIPCQAVYLRNTGCRRHLSYVCGRSRARVHIDGDGLEDHPKLVGAVVRDERRSQPNLRGVATGGPHVLGIGRARNGRRSCERMKSDRIYDFMCMNPRTVISDALVRFQTLYEGSWPEP